MKVPRKIRYTSKKMEKVDDDLDILNDHEKQKQQK